MKRLTLNIVVLLVLGAAFWGFGLYPGESDEKVLTGELEAFKQEDSSRLAMIEEARKAEEQQRAEELKKTAEMEQRRAEQQRLAGEAERQRQETARRETAAREQVRRDAARRQAAAIDERRRKEAAAAKKAPPKLARKTAPEKPPARSSKDQRGKVTGKTVTIKTKVTSTAAQVPLARVHAGDQVTVKIRRVGKADRQILVGLGPLNRHSMGMFPDGPLAGPRVVGKRLKDQDRFTVSHDLLAMGGARFNPDTVRGAILYIGTGAVPAPPHINPPTGKRTGYYEIEIEIRENNRWDLVPESLA